VVSGSHNFCYTVPYWVSNVVVTDGVCKMNAPPFEYVGTGLLALGFVGIGVFLLVAVVIFTFKQIFKKEK
jgi:hypothetical protein